MNVLILRPGYFFENFYATLGLIKHQGINGGAVVPDVPVPTIAKRLRRVARAGRPNRSPTMHQRGHISKLVPPTPA